MAYQKRPITAESAKRYIAKRICVNNVSGCWEWQSGVDKGYGAAYGPIPKAFGCSRSAHRLSYTIYNGVIPEGFLVRHRCNNAICCNPEHLELGSHSQNMKDKFEDLCEQTDASLLNLKKHLEDRLAEVQAELSRRNNRPFSLENP